MKMMKADHTTLTDDLSREISDLSDVLAGISRGDTSLRFSEICHNDRFRKVKLLINQLAEHIQETNSQAHEMAIGLCEHYETLNRISRGDFSARAAVDSGNEVVAKLGELINLEADTLTTAVSRARYAENATKDAYQQLLDIVEFLPDATFVIDKKKRVIAWNRAIEKLTGIGKSEILGKLDYFCSTAFFGDNRPLLIDLLDQDPELHRQDYAHIKKEGNTLFAEVFIPSFRNGESRYFWATATPLFDKEGNRAGGIESIRDITGYKKSEEERSRLKSRIHESSMMESLMIRLGHDLRTPLTPLFVLFPLIRERIKDPEIIKMLDICSKSTTSIKKLVDRAQILVTLSVSIDPGKLVAIPLAPLIDSVLADSADIITQKHVTFKNFADPAISVQGVLEQLKELFNNLISNAVCFSHLNSVVTISAEKRAGTVTVAVKDEGIGLEPTHLDCIFEEFFKVDESRHDLDASGLGLSICKRIVSNHEGRIWAESQGIGKGTTIKFTFNEHCSG